ncbi:MAG: penicillin-binding transpeptidase domain-containing protein [Vescimonas sp.]|uniref:penicillin-binding transpeptidase domain-containing protein n=1 Tax=Vescimonas sp. TaxID=2892404 RepID=UPI002A90D3C0|nr:penicillin-binding transpeptidase domain-containing protein [Vescimonas sp.]MDY5334816.1 penicillin-binding transpeptidase domain-containing protein [Vescimonas sp.]
MAANQNPNRKSESIRRANRIIQTRSFVLMILMGVVMFVLLFFRLFDLQITRHEELQSKAVNQQTRRTVVTASRGTIYDTAGNILAISSSAETIILSPLEIDKALNDTENPVTWTKDSLAAGLAEILGKDAASIRKRMDNVKSQYELIQLRADEEVAARVRAYVEENKISGVHLVADTKRYYPYGSLAAQVIGFVGDDNTGLYGLEAYYEEELEGQSGLVISAKDQAENDMLYTYEQYFAAKNGSDLTLTLDTTIQYYLEKGLEAMTDKFSAANGASGIVMNAKTGGIMAMASYPNYDLNDFLTVSDQTLQERIERGESTLADMQLLQWRNKALNDTYEPGSTFKILTLSAALEEGVVDKTTTVNCGGSVNISGYTIHCSNKNGHGLQTLVQSVGNSCNPAFINYGLRIGNEKFYEYMRSFGLMSTTGIDLGGEAVGVFAADSSFTQLDLACYAFGQNFTVTPLTLISAQAACVNGGYLHTPYLVERITDSDGNVTYRHDSTPVRQVISEQTSATVRECLEYVVASGTGKNGQVAGYRIGGKTGTADKGQTGDVVVSFLCFAPADDPQVIMLITMDTPSRATGTYVSGGNMVAPTASTVMAEILPYLGIEPSYSAEELLGMDTTVPNVIGSTVEQAKEKLKERALSYKIVGDGDTITDQTPAGGAIIPGKSTVILYASAAKPTDKCVVPHLLGKTPSEANTAATAAGLLIRFSGTTGSESSAIRVLSQSIDEGTEVDAGTVITVQLGDTSVTD